jgi:uncharacterized protein (DUF2267 family)
MSLAFRAQSITQHTQKAIRGFLTNQAAPVLGAQLHGLLEDYQKARQAE